MATQLAFQYENGGKSIGTFVTFLNLVRHADRRT